MRGVNEALVLDPWTKIEIKRSKTRDAGKNKHVSTGTKPVVPCTTAVVPRTGVVSWESCCTSREFMEDPGCWTRDQLALKGLMYRKT